MKNTIYNIGLAIAAAFCTFVFTINTESDIVQKNYNDAVCERTGEEILPISNYDNYIQGFVDIFVEKDKEEVRYNELYNKENN